MFLFYMWVQGEMGKASPGSPTSGLVMAFDEVGLGTKGRGYKDVPLLLFFKRSYLLFHPGKVKAGL